MKKSGGFTLLELLTVVAIIGLLVAVVSTNLAPGRAKGRDTARINQMRQIRIALESYYNDQGRYPTASGETMRAVFQNSTPPLIPNYIPEGSATDPTENPDEGYIYTYGSNGEGYTIGLKYEQWGFCRYLANSANPDGAPVCTH